MSIVRLKIALLLAAALAGFGFADAQLVSGIAAGNGAAVNRPKVTVRGVVLDRITKQPIARALVDAMFDAVLTDNEGRFELKLPEGNANLQLRRPGYSSPNSPTRFLHVSATTPDLTLYLTPAANVTGHVSLAGDDDPTVVHFTAYRKGVIAGHELWIPVGFSTVDSDGTFRFLQLDAPGSFIFCSAPSGAPGMVGGKLKGFSQKCFPGGTDFASAAPLELTAGQQAQLDVDLETQPFYNVAISVPATQNMPSIQIHDRGGLIVPIGAVRGRKPGMMEFRLPNGAYYAEVRGWPPHPMYGRVDFTVANGPLQLGVALAPLQAVPVVIHKDFTENAKNNSGLGLQMNTSGEPSPGMQLMLQPAGKLNTEGSGTGLRHVQGGGPEAFEMDAIPGRWRLQTVAYQGYVTSMSSGGVDLLRDPLIIAQGTSVQPIDVTMRNDGGQIQCSLTGANSGNSAVDPSEEPPVYQVVALAQFPAAIPIQMRAGQSDQPVIIGNLPPGDYRVAAFDGVPTIDLDDPDEVARIMAKGQIVHVEPSGTASVQVPLTSLMDVGTAP